MQLLFRNTRRPVTASEHFQTNGFANVTHQVHNFEKKNYGHLKNANKEGYLSFPWLLPCHNQALPRGALSWQLLPLASPAP